MWALHTGEPDRARKPTELLAHPADERLRQHPWEVRTDAEGHDRGDSIPSAALKVKDNYVICYTFTISVDITNEPIIHCWNPGHRRSCTIYY